MKDFSIETFSGNKSDSLLSLVEAEYGNKEISSQEYLDWQYFQNPSGNALITVAREKINDVLSGQYIVLPIQFTSQGKIFNGSLSVNTLTRKEFRGKGLFPAMAEETYKRCAEQKIFFTTGFPNPDSFPVFVNKLQFHHLGDVPFLVKPLNISGVVRSVFTKSNIKRGEETELKNIPDENAADGFAVSEFDLLKDENSYNIFLKDFNQDKIVFTNRSPEFMRWRYIQIPTRKYLLLKVVKENKMLAYAVIRAQQVMKFKTGLLVDFCIAGSVDSKRAGGLLLNHIQKIFIANDLDIGTTIMQSHSKEFALLKSAGFISLPKKLLPQPVSFIIRIHQQFENSSSLLDFKNWFLTFGDFDLF